MYILSRDSAPQVVKRHCNAPPFQIPKFDDNDGISMRCLSVASFLHQPIIGPIARLLTYDDGHLIEAKIQEVDVAGN